VTLVPTTGLFPLFHRFSYSITRSASWYQAWLRQHPEIDLVSRDRGKLFRDAATLGAPQAKQVVDRFHLQVRRIGAYSIPFGERRG